MHLEEPRLIRLDSVNVARAETRLIHGKRVSTAIGKRPVDGPVAVLPLGLEGDEQADATVHGGLSKAVYAYPAEHYAFWQTVRRQAQVPLADQPLPPGSLGENLTISGVEEKDLWLGDRLELPGCVLVVSEPRRPCFKLDHVMGFKHASKMMVQSGWCGTYLAVLEPGTLQAGQTARLVPGPREVNLRELFTSRTKGRQYD